MENERGEPKSLRKTLLIEPKPLPGFPIPGIQQGVQAGTLSYVGKRIPMVDASEKVRGKALYFTDIELPGMLHAKLLRSPLPHARILHINADKALSLPGVKTVLFPQDTPIEKYGPQVADRPILAREKTRFVGEGIVAVAAVDEETAEEAVRLIDVDYEPLPPVLEIDEALREGAPLVHEDRKGNIATSTRIPRGDIEQGWRESDVILEEKFKTPFVHSLYLEPQICVASSDPDGGLLLYLPIQTPFTTRDMMARILGIPLHKNQDHPDPHGRGLWWKA